MHRRLGCGFLEAVYKDAIEFEMTARMIPFERERFYEVWYKGRKLTHGYCADFVVGDKIILEVKALSAGMDNFHIAQTINYLKISGCEVGLLINFGKDKLETRRLILTK